MSKNKDVWDEVEDEILSPEELSKYIKELSTTIRVLLNKGMLTKRAIVVLVYDMLPRNNRHGPNHGKKIANMTQVEAIINTLERLEGAYVQR